MGLSARETQVIEVLLRHPEGITAAGIAGRLGVSARTVHRDLRPAAVFLGARGLALARRPGSGLRVEGTPEARARALEALLGSGSTDLTPEGRRLSLLRTLLGAGEPIKLRALASGLKVAIGTISRDLDWVEGWLADFRLSLLRKRGYGVEVTGTEADRRRAMSHLILENLDESEFLSRPREPIELPAGHVAEQLLGLIDGDRLRRVEALTAAAVERLPYAIADDAFVNLSVHVALMVERLLRGGKIEIGDGAVSRLRETNEYEPARGLAEAIGEAFRIDVPEGEVAYVTMHLRGTKL